MAVSSAAVTVKVVLPETPPMVAEIVALPTAAPVASPPGSAIVATAVLDELHETRDGRSCLELSEKMPVALNCWVRPFATLGAAGVTWINVRTAPVTVRVVLPEMPPLIAEMVAEPTPTAVATPLDETDATAEFDDVHVTWLRFWVEWSEYTPVAVISAVLPEAMLSIGGVTSIDASTAAVTL
jgi:hypothetical protein